MENKNYLLLLLLFVFLINIASAEVQTLGTFRQGSDINLVQNCVNSTYSNITRITAGTNSIFLINQQTPMTKNSDNYNFTFSNTTAIGQYLVYGQCDENGIITNWVYDLFVNYSGTLPTITEGIIYFISVILLIFIFVLCLLATIKIQWTNNTNEEGSVLNINNLKYLKIFMFFMTYITLIGIVYLVWNITLGFLSFNVASNIFQGLFWTLIVFMFPMIVVGLLISVIAFVQDKKLAKAIKRGVPFR